MEETAILLERHEQLLNSLQRDVADLREVQNEIRAIALKAQAVGQV